MMKLKKLMTVMAFGVCFSAIGGMMSLSNVNANADKAVEIDYLLPLYEYTLEGYDESYQIFDSKGQLVVTDGGTFIVKEIGDYRVEKDGVLVKIVRVLSQMPEAEFSVVGEMPTECVAGAEISLPSVAIDSVVETVETYDLAIFFDSELVASWSSINEIVEYRFKKHGEYSIQYSFVNTFGIEESETYSLTTKNEKIIVCENELPTFWACYNKYDLSGIYGFYNERKYGANLTITAPDQTAVDIVDETFVPTQEGQYTLKINVNFEGETLTEERQIQVAYGYASMFYAGSGVQSIRNDVATAQDYLEPARGVETVLSGEGSHVYYNKIIDLDALTKTDSIVNFYFDVTKTTATKIRATLIDINDEKNQLSVYWYHSPWNADRNSFMLVEFNGYTLGLNKGVPDEVFGQTLNSSFKRTDDRVAFNFSYDVEEKTVYTKAGASLLKVMDVDDTELLGIRQPFKGFSANQVYLKIEIMEKADAAIIVSEAAGKSFADNTKIDMKSEQYLRLYYDGFYVKDEDLYDGAFGYYYTLPIPATQDIIGGAIEVEVALYKIENGKKTNITDKIKSDWRFLPKELGKYSVAYSCLDWFGNKIEKEFDFSVRLFAEEIIITNESYSQKLGNYINPPQIDAYGGTGALHSKVEYFYNDLKIEPDSNGRFYLDKTGSITVCVVVTDFLGEEAEKTFEILVDSDVRELNIEEKPISFMEGREYVLSDFSPVNYLFNEGEDGRTMTKTILVNGEEIGQDRKFTFTQSGEATITYIAGKDSQYEIREDVKVYIIPRSEGNTLSLSDYLIFKGDVETFLLENGLGINAEEDFEIVMPNAIPLSNFQFGITAMDGFTYYEKVRLLLEDYTDSTKQLVIEVGSTADGSFTLSVNGGLEYTLDVVSGKYGENVAVDAGYNGKGYRSALFKMYEDEALITAENDIKICSITEYLSGDSFKGFSSGLMRLSIQVYGVSQKTGFVLNNVANQKMTSVAFMRGDRQGAAIGLIDKIVKDAKIDESVKIPSAVAYDILQGKAVSLTGYVQTPNGTKTEFDPTMTTDFLVTSYGAYRVVYEARDYFGNIGKYEYYIHCKDSVSPSVTIPSGIALSYKVGDTLTVPQFKAKDNVEVRQTTALIKTPANRIIVVRDGYTFTYKGQYEIILYAEDTSGNYATKSVFVEVK